MLFSAHPNIHYRTRKYTCAGYLDHTSTALWKNFRNEYACKLCEILIAKARTGRDSRPFLFP